MQINTAPRVPNWLMQHSASTFWLLGVSACVCFTLASFLESTVFYLLPMAGIILLAIIFNIRFLYFILLGVLPFSIEMTLGNFGIDIPSEPIVIALAGFTIIYVLLHRSVLDFSYYKNPIVILIGCHIVWVLFTVFFSQAFITSAKFFAAKCWYILTFFVLTSLLINSQRKIIQWFWCLCIPTVLSVVVILYHHSMYGFTFDSVNRAVEPIYRNHVSYGVFITMFLPFLFLARTWYSQGSLLKLLLTISILVVLAGIYFTYTRGAWLAVAAMPFYYAVIRLRLTRLVVILSLLAVLFFSIYIFHDRTYLKYAPNYETTIYHDELSAHLNSTLEMEDMSTVERFYRWLAAVKMFKEHPLYGVGPGNFATYYKPYAVPAYETYISENEEHSTVHNYFLLLLTEQGIPAVLIFIGLIITILISIENIYHASLSPGDRNLCITIGLCIMAFLVNNTLSDLVEINKLGPLFWMSIAFLPLLSKRANFNH